MVLDIPENLLTAMLIIRKVSPYKELLLRKYPITNLLDIDFLKFDDLDADPLVEGIKNIWVTDLDNMTYLDEEFYDAIERQLQQILAQWFDELSQQNKEFFKEKFFGLDPDTNIFYDEVYPQYIVRRREGMNHFFQLKLDMGNSYSIDMIQEGFSAFGYKVGVGSANSIYIEQSR